MSVVYETSKRLMSGGQCSRSLFTLNLHFINSEVLENATDRANAIASSLATVIAKSFGARNTANAAVLDRCPTFVDKEKSSSKVRTMNDVTLITKCLSIVNNFSEGVLRVQEGESEGCVGVGAGAQLRAEAVRAGDALQPLPRDDLGRRAAGIPLLA